eukprot:scaffold49856_cov36-Phaeocystis_antarctica.AAC.3
MYEPQRNAQRFDSTTIANRVARAAAVKSIGSEREWDGIASRPYSVTGPVRRSQLPKTGNEASTTNEPENSGLSACLSVSVSALPPY